MNRQQQLITVFAAGAATAATIDFFVYRRIVLKMIANVDGGLDLGMVLVEVAMDLCPAIFVDERVTRVIEKNEFDKIVRNF